MHFGPWCPSRIPTLPAATRTLMSASSLAEQKSALRNTMRAKLGALDSEMIRRDSCSACERALALDVVSQCTSASVYLSMPNGECQTEILLRSLFEANKSVLVPRVAGKGREQMQMVRMPSMAAVEALPRNSWGIPEPLASVATTETETEAEVLANIDCVIVPGVAFDSGCRRLGHGRGYYDSFLERLQAARLQKGLPPARTVGLGLQEQLVPAVPLGDHDFPLEYVCLPQTLFVSSTN
eukprot:CAMPEP_0183353754 /NCGR_PEP_ID=MMETSP0164_2-20130417/34884_1 /TAXON_ID=221442 /ORGANISM="Coccolithus pelagicus ssp braarudi, Strain PLY182g" /LENGTH=238 /DNA_ID=CAMNT_0025526489 /DNA_START=1 /DNA_END=717 /DNA_ORIENTATION=+